VNNTSLPELDAIELAALALERQADALHAQATALQMLKKHERDVSLTPAPACLVDRSGLATALAISLPTVDRLCKAGTIPWIQIGDVRRFDLGAVRSALQKCAAKAKVNMSRVGSDEADGAPSGVRRVSRSRPA
jgi:hypothetical protein